MDKGLLDAIAVANHYGVTDAELKAVVEAATAAHRVETPGRVVIEHTKLHRQMLVDPDSVPVYEKSGWRLKAADVPAAKSKTEKSEETS